MRRLLQRWTKSSIILASKEESVWRTKGPEAGPFPSLKTNRLPDLRVLPGHWNKWFRRELCRPIHYQSTKWWYSGIRFEMGRNFHCLWRKSHLMISWKDCTNYGYESLRNSRPCWNCTIWRFTRRKLDLKITDWRQWWKEVSSRKYEPGIFGARNGNYERNVVVKNQGTKQRGQRILGYCWQWETNGQCSKRDNCSFRHEMNKRAKMTQPIRRREMRRVPNVPEERVPVVEYLDGPTRITSKELAITHFVKSGTLQNACSTRPREVAYLEKNFLYAHRQVDEQPSTRSKKNNQECSSPAEEECLARECTVTCCQPWQKSR